MAEGRNPVGKKSESYPRLAEEKKRQEVSESPTNKNSVDIVRMQHP